MRLNPVVGTFLCLVTWMDLANAIPGGGHTSNCCPAVSNTRVPVENIKSYRIQSEGLCFVSAVVFKTKKGRRICSDPNNEWTQKAMRAVDERTSGQQEARQSDQVTTADVTAAPPTEAGVGRGTSSGPESEWATTVTVKVEEEMENLPPADSTEAEVEPGSHPKEECSAEATLKVEGVTQSEKMTTSDVTAGPPTEAAVGRGTSSDPRSDWATKAVLKAEEETKSPEEAVQGDQVTTGDVTPVAAPKQATVGPRSRPEEEHSTKALLKMETQGAQEERDSTGVSPRNIKPAVVKKARRLARRRRGRKVRRSKCNKGGMQPRSKS